MREERATAFETWGADRAAVLHARATAEHMTAARRAGAAQGETETKEAKPVGSEFCPHVVQVNTVVCRLRRTDVSITSKQGAGTHGG